MSVRVPWWALAVLASVLVVATALGFASDGGLLGFDIQPFSLNVLSSAAAFSASGLFASLLLNRYVRRKYWGVELNRRVRAAAQLEQLIRDTRTALLVGQRTARGAPIAQPESAAPPLQGKRSLLELLLDETEDDIRSAEIALASAQSREEMAGMTPPEAALETPPAWTLGIGATIEHQLDFVSDARLLHATDRLDHKLGEMRAAYDSWRRLKSPIAYLQVLGPAHGMVEAASEVAEWLLGAPDAAMRANVLEGLRDSGSRPRTGI